MGDIIRDLGSLMGHVFSPDTFAFLLMVGGTVAGIFRILKKQIGDLHRQALKSIEDRLAKLDEVTDSRLDDVEKEVLRLQLLEGMNSYRLSPSEVSFFYDRYRALGGNSFVTERVHTYLKEFEERVSKGE